MQAKSKILLVLCLCLIQVACAATRPPNPAAPIVEQPRYPVFLFADSARREAALTLWSRLSLVKDGALAPDLHPVTSTVRGLPAHDTALLVLPRVGSRLPMSEEETREALRRFIISTGSLLCADSDQLSLVQRMDLANGPKIARYEQNPFRYPLRGGYGGLEITFLADGRVQNVSSTCLPGADQLQRSLLAVRTDAALTPERLLQMAETAQGQVARAPESTVAKATRVDGLVIVARDAQLDRPALEFRLAWELSSSLGHIYIDATDGSTISLATPE